MKRDQQFFVAGSVVAVPPSLIKDRYQAGFAHAMRGGQLDDIDYFRLSFREGFRAAKLQLRELRRRRDIIDFPMKARLRVTVR
jgi:hypothetical protein